MSTENDDDQVSDRELFRQAIRGIKPLKQDSQAFLYPVGNRNLTGSRREESHSLDRTSSALVDPGPDIQIGSQETLWHTQPGLPNNTARRLRRGQLPISNVLDLHGLTVNQARDTVSQFIHSSQRAHQTCVLIIHGKGGRSAGSEAVLKRHVSCWLTQIASVMAYSSAQQHDGGSGALYTLLKASRGDKRS